MLTLTAIAIASRPARHLHDRRFLPSTYPACRPLHAPLSHAVRCLLLPRSRCRRPAAHPAAREAVHTCHALLKQLPRFVLRVPRHVACGAVQPYLLRMGRGRAGAALSICKVWLRWLTCAEADSWGPGAKLRLGGGWCGSGTGGINKSCVGFGTAQHVKQCASMAGDTQFMTCQPVVGASCLPAVSLVRMHGIGATSHGNMHWQKPKQQPRPPLRALADLR